MRYIPISGKTADEMLKDVGQGSMQKLFDTQIPKAAQYKKDIQLPDGISEIEVRRLLKKLAKKNHDDPSKNFCGAGFYHHYVPSIVDNLAGRSEFLTAYTPYQPEISQGTLRQIFEFQSFLTTLTRMDIANASMYDGSTAFAEAILMARRIQPKKKKVLFSKNIHPEYINVAKTSSNQFGLEFIDLPYLDSGQVDTKKLEELCKTGEVSSVCVQTPNFFGITEDLKQISSALGSDAGKPMLVVAIPEAMSLALYEAPGSFGADIVCGEVQSFGNYPGFGGPGAGFFATKQKYVRNMPGRVVGQTLDSQGKTAFCLTLATREQHIRREKATSNICTNTGWCATRSTIYLSTMGSKGLREVAEQCYSNAHYLAERLSKEPGVKLAFTGDFFNEFLILVDDLPKRLKKLTASGIAAGARLSQFKTANFDKELMDNGLLVAATEIHSKEDLDGLHFR